MATVAQIIARALRVSTAIPSGETPTTQEYSDALETLNGMINSWSTKRTALYAPSQATASLAKGVTSFTIGSGSDVDTTRPKSILSAYLRDSSNQDYPLLINALKEYERQSVKNIQGIPEKIYVRKGLSEWTCYFDYVTDEAYTIVLELYQPLTTYSAVTETVTLPGEYEDAYVYGLAIREAPSYGKEAPSTIHALAAQTLQNVKLQNSHPVFNTISKPFGRDARTNIFTG